MPPLDLKFLEAPDPDGELVGRLLPSEALLLALEELELPPELLWVLEGLL